ncbi:MAG: sugar ABC transporter ATP-binding protein [Anaerolineales bacterium]|nr:sugar ABC transporter ATP-binding protein [Anaerolineales bacterium]
MPNSHLLSMRGISKAFPGVQALDGVDFELNAGEVMALVGENGAGKSTLIKTLAGAHTADSGEIFINGRLAEITNPRQAQALGVAVIYQELELAEQLSVAENIFVGREFHTRTGLIDFSEMYRQAQALLDELRIDVDPRVEVRRLSIAHKQMVEIARALSTDANILVMDEPTSSLPTTSVHLENEVEVLLRLIERLRQRGKAVVYISHRMDEIFRISDRITVLRDGRLIGVQKAAETNPDQIVSMMVGRDLEDLYGHRGEIKIGEPVLELRNLNGVSLQVRSGEILGLSGLIGAGRTELALTLFGSGIKHSGELFVEGKLVNITSPQGAIAAGLGYVPEDRKSKGLFLEKPVRQNISAAITDKISKNGFIQRDQERDVAKNFIKKLGIRTPSMEQHARNLSGGNQQKVVLAKWMAVQPKVLILDEPTRGVDVGAKAEIYALMHEMVKQGMAIIMISSELPEVLALSDRIVVMREGKYAGELDGRIANEEKIMALATGTSGGA